MTSKQSRSYPPVTTTESINKVYQSIRANIAQYCEGRTLDSHWRILSLQSKLSQQWQPIQRKVRIAKPGAWRCLYQQENARRKLCTSGGANAASCRYSVLPTAADDLRKKALVQSNICSQKHAGTPPRAAKLPLDLAVTHIEPPTYTASRCHPLWDLVN